MLLCHGNANAAEPGEPAPDFLGRTLKGEEVRLSDSHGRLRIISFWATWCPPCRKELPLLAAIASEGKASNVEVIAINLKESRTRYRQALRIMDEYPIRFAHDRNGSVARRFGVRGIPHLLIVDSEGRIVYKKIGYGESQVDSIVAEVNRQVQRERFSREDGIVVSERPPGNH
jgi:thiol-disulfide isomerase/thioredoxin